MNQQCKYICIIWNNHWSFGTLGNWIVDVRNQSLISFFNFLVQAQLHSACLSKFWYNQLFYPHMKHIRLKPTECQPQLLDAWMMIDIGPERFFVAGRWPEPITLNRYLISSWITTNSNGWPTNRRLRSPSLMSSQCNYQKSNAVPEIGRWI